MLEDRPGPGLRGLILFQHRLLAPLREAQEQREEPRADEQELRCLGADGDRTRDHSEDEQATDGHHVDDHETLEDKGIRGGDHAVERDKSGDLGVDREAERQRAGSEDHRQSRRRPHGDRTAGDRPVTLLGMQTVVLPIANVVEQVAGAGDRAEGDKRERGVDHGRALVEAAREQQAGEDQQVLDPLRRAQRPNQRRHDRGRLGALDRVRHADNNR